MADGVTARAAFSVRFAFAPPAAYPQYPMSGLSTMAKTLAIALLLALTVLCLGDLAQAFMPDDEHANCVSRLCDERTGCRAAAPGPVALPIAIPLSVDASVGLAAPALALRLVKPLGPPARQVVPLAPRSPPSA